MFNLFASAVAQIRRQKLRLRLRLRETTLLLLLLLPLERITAPRKIAS